jgi:hypothetical protein
MAPMRIHRGFSGLVGHLWVINAVDGSGQSPLLLQLREKYSQDPVDTVITSVIILVTTTVLSQE